MKTSNPNILFILADDLGWGDVEYHGSDIRTPNIDYLVNVGIELDNHYVQPMCTPTRTALLSGRYPSRFGDHATIPSNHPVFPDGYETLSTLLGKAGYDTGLFGKWHLGSSPEYGPNTFGFDWSYGSLAGGVDPYSHYYKSGIYSKTWHRNGSFISEQGHVTDLILEEAMGWIESRERPWFAYIPFTAVHVPVKVPDNWLAKYDNQKFDCEVEKDRSFKQYAAYASHMDHAIGRLTGLLKENNQFEDTIIVFASDNGALESQSLEKAQLYPGVQEASLRLGSNLPLRGQKGQLYEGGIRTPASITWHNTFKPRKLEKPLHISDWMPTFSEIVDQEPDIDPEWDGLNICSLLAGEDHNFTATDRKIYWMFRGNEIAMRIGKWKLITKKIEGSYRSIELYDIESDPFESFDLSDYHQDVAERLLRVIENEQVMDGSAMRFDAGDAMPVQSV